MFLCSRAFPCSVRESEHVRGRLPCFMPRAPATLGREGDAASAQHEALAVHRDGLVVGKAWVGRHVTAGSTRKKTSVRLLPRPRSRLGWSDLKSCQVCTSLRFTMLEHTPGASTATRHRALRARISIYYVVSLASSSRRLLLADGSLACRELRAKLRSMRIGCTEIRTDCTLAHVELPVASAAASAGAPGGGVDTLAAVPAAA